MHDPLTDFATAAMIAAVALPGFPVLGFVIWLALKHRERERALNHTERLKALELGQPLPDAEIARLQTANQTILAQIGAVNQRINMAGVLAVFVPLFMAGAAVGGTALLLSQAAAAMHLPLICVIWGVSGLVSLASLVPIVLVVLQGHRRHLPSPDEGVVESASGPESPLVGIRERPPSA